MATRIFPDLTRQCRKAGISGRAALDRALDREPPTMNVRTTEVAAISSGRPSKNGKMVPVWFGDEQPDQKTGELRPKWKWLPAKLISMRAAETGQGLIVTLPEWLAKKEGLI